MPHPQFLLSAKLRTVAIERFRFPSPKRLVAVVLALQMLFLPSSVSAVALSDAIRDSGATATAVRDSFLSWLTLSPPQAPNARGVKPPPPEQMSDKITRLARLQINPKGAVQLESHERMWFTAVPFDSEGSAIHGLQAEWESSDKQVVFVKRDGQALAGKPGAATVTARAGSLSASVQVIVSKSDGEPFGKKKADSTRNNLRVRQSPAGSARETLSSRTGMEITFRLVMRVRTAPDQRSPASSTRSDDISISTTRVTVTWSRLLSRA